MTNKLFLIIACLGYSANTLATIFIEMDFEGGKVPYVGSSNKHPGGGYISYLGGEIHNGITPGDGTQDYSKYNNVILDNSSDAKTSINGSNYSLKTQYKAGHERSYQKNTTIINFPETKNVYVRWYQKWSKSWQWPTGQHKLLKMIGPGSAQSLRTSGGSQLHVVKKSSPPKANLNQTFVFSDRGNKADTAWKQDDSIAGNSAFYLKTNRWYCIETMVKSSTLKDSKGEFAYWINDDLKLHLKNSFNYVEGSDTKRPNFAGINYIEMQHIRQNVDGSDITVDMPTWMDNIVISDQRIGCSGIPPQSTIVPPNPPRILGL